MTARTFIEEVELARKVWMEENPCEDGVDHVTPFDRFLYGTAPVEAQRCTCPSGDGSLRWPCPAHPAEAQAQGGGERPRLAMPDHIGLYQGPDDCPHLQLNGVSVAVFPAGSWSEVCDVLDSITGSTAPPSAPVGVEAIVDRLAADRNYSRGEAVDDLRRILAQQPAAVDGVLIAAMEDGFTFQKPLPAPYMTDEANEQRAWVVERNRPPFCDESGVSVWAGPTPQEALACARRALAAQPGGAE